MSNELFQKFEDKINQVLEMIESQRSQLNDALDENDRLLSEISGLKMRQAQWEKSLTKLLCKIDAADYKTENQNGERQKEEYERTEAQKGDIEDEDLMADDQYVDEDEEYESDEDYYETEKVRSI